MSYPVIGVTTMRRKNSAGMTLASLAEAYVDALTQAGACPVLIPNALPEAALDELLPRLDGVLFTGGGDIETTYYQEQVHPKVSGVEPDRDRLEIILLKKVVQESKPFLGICRGLQLINVGLGGSLYTDIADQVPGAAKHDYYPDWKRDHLAHPVEVNQDTRLADILGGSEVEVNSLHHQAVRQLAPGLVATASSPDGIIEALELVDHPFGLAVQWHPEWLTAHAAMRALFKAFSDSAREKDKLVRR
ncbi:MAG: gamma-glutamyl-gamma-aminobutyrate hydrolase family protein [Anaerolineales bacterium]